MLAYCPPYRLATRMDLPLLHEWRNSETFRAYCTWRRNRVTKSEFEAELRAAFKFDRCEQMMIIHGEKPVGTMFSYRYSPDDYLYMSIFLSKEARGHAIGVRALALWCKELFNKLQLHKIYFEVYGSNTPVSRILCRLGLSLESDLKGHREIDGKRVDLRTYAL